MRRRAFTLIELLVVVSIIAILIAILLPALGSARRSAQTLQCLANIRSLAIAQYAFATDNDQQLVQAGGGAYQPQGSWLSQLDAYADAPVARRCPDDGSAYFDTPLPDASPPAYRTSSYGINNYLSPTHAPAGARVVRKLDDVSQPSVLVQFAELAQQGAYAGADHLHVDRFVGAWGGGDAASTLARIGQQMPVGRHGEQPTEWSAPLNFSFLDGHAETVAIERVYTDPTTNQFDPTVAR